MGLFSKKKVVTVSTSVMRVLEDKALPNSLKKGLVQGLFDDNGTQLVEHVLEESLSSIGVRAERAYRFGRDKYINGLPGSTLLSNTKGSAEVQNTLEDLAGRTIDIEYYKYGPLNNLHYGWATLVSNYGYDTSTNELATLSNVKKFPVYLQDLQVIAVDITDTEERDGSLDHWGTSPTSGKTPLRPAQTQYTKRLSRFTPNGIDPSAARDYFRLTYIWRDATKAIKTESVTFNMCDIDSDAEYFQVKYSYPVLDKTDPFGVKTIPLSVYWTYKAGTGTYPVLDEVFTTPYEAGSYFPFVYFRYNKVSTAEDTTSQEYKDSKKLLKYLNMDFGDIGKAINDNPDIKDITSAFLMLAVPAHSTEDIECRYLYDFFENMYFGRSNIEQESRGFLDENGQVSPVQYSMVIQDKKFRLSLQLKGLYKEYIVGTLPDNKKYVSGVGTRTRIEKGITYASPYDTVGVPFSNEITYGCHYYQHQLSEGLYEEIRVDDLSLNYYVEGRYLASGTEEGKNLLIPLEHIITERYTSTDRELLYARSLHYVFNAKVVKYLKWYQQGWFQAILMIVGIVITIFSMGSGASSMAAVMAAATSSISAFFSMVIIPILKYLAIKLVLKLFVKALGPQFAMLLAVVAACYGLYDQGFEFGTAGSPWATGLLKVSTGLMDSVNEYLTDSLAEIQKDFDAFAQYKEESNKLLKEHQDLLDNQTILNPFVLYGESPTAYLDRSVHTGNPGVMCFDALTNYVDVALRLPDIDQTLRFTV